VKSPLFVLRAWSEGKDVFWGNKITWKSMHVYIKTHTLPCHRDSRPWSTDTILPWIKNKMNSPVKMFGRTHWWISVDTHVGSHVTTPCQVGLRRKKIPRFGKLIRSFHILKQVLNGQDCYLVITSAVLEMFIR
jgi:hypothetical protein